LPQKKDAPHISPGPSKTTTPKPSTHITQVDWHDKQNWRRFLHTGMSRKEVRRLFGEPEQMSVSGDTEFWGYGLGDITFQMENHPDGSLNSWDEPR
jgi:hypothetical protein